MRIRVFLALLLSTALYAQQAPPKKAAIFGKVISQSGQALRKADVRAIAPGQAATMGTAVQTDGEGNFTVPDLEPGTYQIVAQKSGYLMQMYGARKPMANGTSVRLGAGQELHGIDFKLTEAGTITGRVLDEDGDPLNGMSIVVAMRPGFANGKAQWTPVGTAMASGGLYSMGNLPPGKYAIMASPVAGTGPAATTAGGIERAYAATYYPRALDRESATLVDVTPGLQLNAMDITLEKVRVYKVKGKLDGDGNPGAIAATAVGQDLISSLLPKGQASIQMPERTFALSLPPGTYKLVGATQVLGGEPWGPVEVTVTDRDVEGVALGKLPPMSLSGKVVLEGWPAASKVSSLVLRLRPEELSVTTILAMATPTKISDAGEFTVEKLSPGKFTVELTNLPEKAYVKQVTMGGAVAPGHKLDLTSGTPGAVEITLSGKAASLEGTVRLDGENPMGAAQVVLVPAPELRKFDSAYASATADGSGHFTFRSVAPGKYKLFAWEEIEAGAWMDPDMMSKVESKGIAVTLAEGDQQTAVVDGILSPDITPEQREQERKARTGEKP